MAGDVERAAPSISDIETRTVEFVDRIRASSSRDEWPHPDRPSRFVTREKGSLCISGDGLAALRGLMRLHASDSYGRGMTVETVEGIVLDALMEDGAASDVIASEILAAVAATTPQSYTVVAPAPMVSLPREVEALRVGSCEYRQSLPEEFAPEDRDRRWVGDRLDGRVVIIEVATSDYRAVEAMAMQQLQVSNSVLSLATGGLLRRRPEVLLRQHGEGRTSVSRSVPDPLLVPWRALDTSIAGSPAWRQGWAELVDAVGRPDRSQWEERVVMATVWLDRMKRAWLADEAVVAGFAALEALLLPTNSGKGKASQLADRVGGLGRLPDFNAAEQRAWLKRLYERRRTEAIHYGRSVDHDLDVHRLVDLVDHVLKRWGMRHLIASHRSDGRACTTVAETLDEAAHPS